MFPLRRPDTAARTRALVRGGRWGRIHAGDPGRSRALRFLPFSLSLRTSFSSPRPLAMAAVNANALSSDISRRNPQDEYELIQRIGSGTYGDVYKVGIFLEFDSTSRPWRQLSPCAFSLRRLNGSPWTISRRLRLSNWSQVSATSVKCRSEYRGIVAYRFLCSTALRWPFVSSVVAVWVDIGMQKIPKRLSTRFEISLDYLLFFFAHACTLSS